MFERLRVQAVGYESAIADGEQRAATLRDVVQQRAARAYRGAGSSLPSLLTVGDLPDLMRSDKLLATANVKDADALSLLLAQQEDLKLKREDLRKLEDRQSGALVDLQRSSKRADAQLAAALSNRQDVQARLAAQAAATRIRVTRTTSSSTTTRTRAPPAPARRRVERAGSGERRRLGLASRRPVPLVRPPAREPGQLRGHQPGRPLVRGVPVPRVDLEHHRAPRRAARPRRRAAVERVGLGPGRHGLEPLPVARFRAVGRKLLSHLPITTGRWTADARTPTDGLATRRGAGRGRRTPSRARAKCSCGSGAPARATRTCTSCTSSPPASSRSTRRSPSATRTRGGWSRSAPASRASIPASPSRCYGAWGCGRCSRCTLGHGELLREPGRVPPRRQRTGIRRRHGPAAARAQRALPGAADRPRPG